MFLMLVRAAAVSLLVEVFFSRELTRFGVWLVAGCISTIMYATDELRKR